MNTKEIVKITDGESYINSLRNRNLTVYLFGEKIKEPVDHDMIRPSINAIAKTFDLATVSYTHLTLPTNREV